MSRTEEEREHAVTGSPSQRSLLDMVLDTLHVRLRALDEAAPVLRAFAGWLGYSMLVMQSGLDELARRAAAKEGAGRHYQDVAVLGFASARLRDTTFSARFRDGLKWMRGRRFFVPNQPLGFEADGLAILGVASGICEASDPATRDSDRQWLLEIVSTSLERSHESSEAWDVSLLHAASLLLDADQVSEDAIRRVTPDLAAALAAVGILHVNEEDERAARQVIVGLDMLRHAPLERVVVHAVALPWLLRQGANALPMRASASDVRTLLAALSHAFKRWPWEDRPKTSRAGAVAQRWDVQNEYHVQSLLWAILAPIFPDLEDEEYLRSLGHKHPRVDLAIPSIGLIIEVKFLREGTQSAFANVIGEIASDTGLYLSHPSEFTQIIAFIWDNSRSTEHHAELLSGLRCLHGITDAVVVPRPGGWEPR